MEQRMRSYNWTIVVDTGRACVKIDGDISQPQVQAQLKQALRERGCHLMNPTEKWLGFVLERKPPANSIPIARSTERDDDFEEWMDEGDLAHIGGIYSDEEEGKLDSDNDTKEKQLADIDNDDDEHA
ncbi:hypothetical protein CC86DRAFT_419754 [Ophiobolus disseminans]|uniref:Uncharacterized protein n=1 Tax=Ophiobolus disseminans TaxID=1469910 RepID=A0A6A6ZVK2_9PLEO|nr:hypothetical protein CC86DRAFT_419754 [Ophiobolus disseminans]